MWYARSVCFYALFNRINRMIDPGETTKHGAEGECEISQAKGPGQDDAS